MFKKDLRQNQMITRLILGFSLAFKKIGIITPYTIDIVLSKFELFGQYWSYNYQ